MVLRSNNNEAELPPIGSQEAQAQAYASVLVDDVEEAEGEGKSTEEGVQAESSKEA